ncbi:MAG: DUF362 domain-containing protein [Candidatus Bathyarchaeota archaeon]|nr:DUF362 domain-containing protein [Candidatus Bathyarchaeota archaeon]
MPPTKIVKICQAKQDISDILKEAVKNSDLKGKNRIFIKPNLSHPEYLPGVVTDPYLTYLLVSLLRNNAQEVIVGESDGFNYPCRVAFQKTGMEAAVKKAGGTIINLSEDQIIKVKFPESNTPIKHLFLPKTILDADARIDLPLMKTHEFMLYSGAIKNLFGCIPSNRRIYLHPYLPAVFFYLYQLFKPQLTIMDARTGIEGNGPTKGKPVKLNLIITGTDALAVDIVSTQVMGLKWKETYLNYIAKKTSFQEEDIQIQGPQISEVKREFELPRIDLPVKAQMEIYKHEYLTKFFFCSLDVVKLFQKVTLAYRGKTVQFV